MDFQTFKDTLLTLQTDEEKLNLIRQRLSSLSQESSSVDLNSDTGIYESFIPKTCNFKPANNVEGFSSYGSDSLSMDDDSLYLDFVKQLSITDYTFTPDSVNEITEFVNNYFGECCNNDPIRMNFYDKGTTHSLHELKGNGIAMCSERAALAHNILKFLGIDSKMLTGKIENEAHAFVLFSPKSGINFIYDPANNVNFNANGIRYRYSKLALLSETELNSLLSGEQYNFNYDWLQRKMNKRFNCEVQIEKESKPYFISSGEEIRKIV
jgi:hypothetical protein